MTQNASCIYLSLIPSYILALILLYVFYEVGHVWRKEGVVLGFQFSSSLPADGGKPSLQQIISQTNHRGFWVTADSSVRTFNAEKVGRQETLKLC